MDPLIFLVDLTQVAIKGHVVCKRRDHQLNNLKSSPLKRNCRHHFNQKNKKIHFQRVDPKRRLLSLKSIKNIEIKKVSIKFKKNHFNILLLVQSFNIALKKTFFTGQYLRWEPNNPLKRKISLIPTLAHRALMICTKRKLSGKIERIRKTLPDNGYPKNVVNSQIAKKIAQFSTLKRFGPEKCPV